jgi:hypothetical protein
VKDAKGSGDSLAPPEPAKELHEDAEECGDVSHDITDHVHTTTSTASPAAPNNPHLMTSATELEDVYTTHHQLGLPPEKGGPPSGTIPCHIRPKATSPVGENNTDNDSTGAVEHTEQSTIQLANAYAVSWERSENDNRYNEPECDGVSAEDISTTDDEDDVAECAPARAARARTHDKHETHTQ